MDPLARAEPDVEGYVTLLDGVKLHYELYRPQQPPPAPSSSSSSSASGAAPPAPAPAASRSPLLMVMGAFATKLHFATTARHVADACGHDVCIYDHRGVARSGPAVLEAQTAAQLAADALVVVDSVWGPDAAIHLYGASMGGMVAQELALALIPRRRLLSLTLAITCRGLQPAYGLLGPLLTPRVLRLALGAWFRDTRPRLVARLKRLLLARSMLDMRHPGSGETYDEVYSRAWLEGFDELWTFADPAAGACHAHVVLHHHLSDAQLAALRGCGVPLLVQVATKDRLIPSPMQFQLAEQLRARTVTFPTGHMGMLPWKERFHAMLQEQLAMGEAIKGVHRAERARSSAGGGGTKAGAAAAAGGANGASNRDSASGSEPARAPSAAAALPDLVVELGDGPLLDTQAPTNDNKGSDAAAAAGSGGLAGPAAPKPGAAAAAAPVAVAAVATAAAAAVADAIGSGGGRGATGLTS